MKVYKLFRLKNDKIYPLYVLHKEPLKMNVVLKAKEGKKNKRWKSKK